MSIRPGHIELFVRDPMKSREFFEGILRFHVLDVQHDRFVWIGLEGLTILLRPGTPPAPASNYQKAPSGLVLYTDDLAATRRELQSRGLEFHGTDGSDQCLTFQDPDGNWFQLVNPDHHT